MTVQRVDEAALLMAWHRPKSAACFIKLLFLAPPSRQSRLPNCDSFVQMVKILGRALCSREQQGQGLALEQRRRTRAFAQDKLDRPKFMHGLDRLAADDLQDKLTDPEAGLAHGRSCGGHAWIHVVG